MEKKDILNYTLEELRKAVTDISEPPYRADQIFSWIYKIGVTDFCQIKNIPCSLVDKLSKVYYIGKLGRSGSLRSSDGAEKILLKLADGHFIETVSIQARERLTLCLSTQLGCKFACAFCASGLKGFSRNLAASEILGQILSTIDNKDHRPTNYVFMGMGEPLDNYENVAKAIIIMNESKGLNVGARRITISTCGIIPGIDKLKTLGLQVNLSISLHAGNNNRRNSLMPVNRLYPFYAINKYTAKALYIKASGFIKRRYLFEIASDFRIT